MFCLVLDGCAHVVGIAVARDEAIANEHEGCALDADLVGVVLRLFDLCCRFRSVGIGLEARDIGDSCLLGQSSQGIHRVFGVARWVGLAIGRAYELPETSLVGCSNASLSGKGG